MNRIFYILGQVQNNIIVYAKVSVMVHSAEIVVSLRTIELFSIVSDCPSNNVLFTVDPINSAWAVLANSGSCCIYENNLV